MSHPDEPPPSDAVPRRAVLDLALAASACGLGVTAAVPAIRFATPPAEGPASTDRSIIGRTETFAPNTAHVVSFGSDAVLVVGLPGGDLRAFEARCTHLGCIVQFSPAHEQFECPCHGGRYALDGRVVAGPPPTGLRELPIEIHDGVVTLVRG